MAWRLRHTSDPQWPLQKKSCLLGGNASKILAMTLASQTAFMRQARAAAAGRPRAHPLVQELTRLRIAKGVSQADLAEKSGYHEDTISKMELGVRQPRLYVLIDCLNALEADLRVVGRD